MNRVTTAALEVQRFMRKNRWRFCIIGGVAIIRWGEPRATRDVDLLLLFEPNELEAVIDSILAKFDARIPDAKPFAVQSHVLLCNASNGIEIDIGLASSPHEARIVDRASEFCFSPKCSLLTASAEDMVVLKAIADRGRDWVEISEIVIRQGSRLDWDYIIPNLTELCELKEDSSPLERLDRLRLSS